MRCYLSVYDSSMKERGCEELQIMCGFVTNDFAGCQSCINASDCLLLTPELRSPAADLQFPCRKDVCQTHPSHPSHLGSKRRLSFLSSIWKNGLPRYSSKDVNHAVPWFNSPLIRCTKGPPELITNHYLLNGGPTLPTSLTIPVLNKEKNPLGALNSKDLSHRCCLSCFSSH